MLIAYFTDCALKFVPADYSPTEGEYVLSKDELSRAKVIKIFQSCNTIVVPCSDCKAEFSRFASSFKWVEAAGGVVVNSRAEILMIYRRGRWDLPKGRIDFGEDAATAACREVVEETGVAGVKIVDTLSNTLHCYNVYGEWEMKLTHWFVMSCQSEKTIPQSEEDIELVKWCVKEQVVENKKNTYPTIIEVIDEYAGKYTLG
ncbi:MAG: NUDIX domain-containing protein [Alistipes sp.]|nr:NUDIX domain-containing protein [Alistipes sp.]